MKYIFIGNLVDYNSKKVEKRSFPQNQAKGFQLNFIDGLIDNVGSSNVKIIALPLFGSFLFSKSDFFYSKKGLEYRDTKFVTPTFINLPVVKNLFWLVFIIQNFKMLSQKSKTEEINVILYSSENGFLAYPLFLKKFTNLKLTIIITDLPDYLNDTLTESKSANIRLNLYKKLLNKFHKFILITDQINELLEERNFDYTVIDGFYVPQAVIVRSKKQHQNKIIVYAGTLDIKYGINELLKVAEMTTDIKVEFWVFGFTDSKDLIHRMEGIKNIKFHGFRQQSELYEHYLSADAFIIPRPIGLNNNRYSNPSKLYEYLSFDKPIIINNLPSLQPDLKKILLINSNVDDPVMGFIDLIIAFHESGFKKHQNHNNILKKRMPYQQVQNYLKSLL